MFFHSAHGVARRLQKWATRSRRKLNLTVRQDLHSWSANCEIVISLHCSAVDCAVLVESPIADRPGHMIGTSCRYAPVVFPGDASQRKQFVDATAHSMFDGRIQGTLLA